MRNQTTEAVYAYIKEYRRQHGNSPSIRNIAKACYLAGATVIRHLDKLEAWGWIEREPGVARGIILVEEKDKE